MTNVNFEVLSIKKANKPEFVVVEIKFNDSSKVFTYVRKYAFYKYKCRVVIDGCEIWFEPITFKVISVDRLYETAGKKKLSTESQSGKQNKIQQKVSEQIKTECQSKGLEIPTLVKTDDNGIVKHEKYDVIKTCLMANIPVYLAGPAGSGKNFTVEQIAKELGWNFYFSNSVQQEYKLTGFIDAGGKFHETEFYKACTDDNDCIFFLDEMDASIPEVLVLLNAAIANGYFEFPNGKVSFDKVHFVSAGNTVGNGADEAYTGRMVLDQATLDRFVIIEFGYDKNVELSLAKGNAKLVDFIHSLRKSAETNGVRATFSYRCISQVTKLESAGMDIKVCLQIAVFKGLDKDTINTMKTWCAGTNKYQDAFNEMKAA